MLHLATALACVGGVSGFGMSRIDEQTTYPYQMASLSAYPDYRGDLSVTGVVVVTETADGIEITGTLNGLESSVSGGLHIHEGKSDMAIA